MKPFQIFYATAIVALGSQVLAVPIDSTLDEAAIADTSNETSQLVSIDENKQPTTPGPNTPDLETSNSNQEATYVVSKYPHRKPARMSNLHLLFFAVTRTSWFSWNNTF